MKKWIQNAVSKPGALHEQLGISIKKKIPLNTLESAAHKGGKLGQRARFAMNMKHIQSPWMHMKKK